MPSPTSSSSASSVNQTTSLSINALIEGNKWGGATGTGATLTYSFPWSSGSSTFSGHTASESYSTLNEQNATYHFGLSTTQQAAARSALQSWANVANITLSEVPDTSSNVGDIRFAWTSSPSNAWGWAYSPDSYWPLGGDVWISTLDTSTATDSWSTGSYNYSSLIHELGHALGLKHSFEATPILPSTQESKQYTIMSYTDSPHSLFVKVTSDASGASLSQFDVVPDTPMLYDVAAIQYLYGANLSYNTGDNVYTFDPATPFFRTIWDAGGTDTISVSNFTKGCTIDLQQGDYSKITIESDSTAGFNWSTPPPKATYDGTDNLAIAYGCVIENAIGGSGNDTLIGNDSNNSLTGGSGNDIINGGAGIDTAVFSGSRAGYVITATSAGFTITSTAEGTDTLTNVEYAKFADQTVTLIATPTITTTKAKVFMGVDDSFTASNIGTTIYGNTGNDVVTVAAGATGVILDQNIERINFPESVSSYTFRQTGNMINVYDASGSNLLAKAPVQGDTDGTLLSFNNSIASALLSDVGIMTLGGATVKSTAATSLTPATTSTQSTTGSTKAKIFMGVDDSFTVSNSNATIYGNTGNDAVTISSGISNVTFDQNIERINFSTASSSYAFRQTGNMINIYDQSGVTLIAKAPVQGDADGTVLAFSNVTASTLLGITGVMTLGGATVSSSAATTLSWA